MHNNTLKVLIAGGGTGGHLFPAFAIATALRKRLSHVDIHFVGSMYGIEARHFKKRSEMYTLLNIRGFVRSFSPRAILRNLLFPFRFLFSYLKSKHLLSIFEPDVVLGTGGYASGLPLLAAIHKKIPTVIHEQNSYPGYTTRWLSARVDRVCLSYQDAEVYLKKKTLLSRGIQFVRGFI